jgi:hypothetical protein
LLSSPQAYEGKSVLTTANIGSNEHDTMVYDANCGSTSSENRSADMEFPSDWTATKLAKKLSKILRHNDSARVTFVAKFSSSGGPYGMLGAKYRFNLIRLISVETISQKSDKRAARFRVGIHIGAGKGFTHENLVNGLLAQPRRQYV